MDIKDEILDAEAILSCASAHLRLKPARVTEALKEIEEARAALLKLAEDDEKNSVAKSN